MKDKEFEWLNYTPSGATSTKEKYYEFDNIPVVQLCLACDIGEKDLISRQMLYDMATVYSNSFPKDPAALFVPENLRGAFVDYVSTFFPDFKKIYHNDSKLDYTFPHFKGPIPVIFFDPDKLKGALRKLDRLLLLQKPLTPIIH